MEQQTPGGVRVDGQVAEVWQAGRQVGTLWDWHLEGHSARWLAYASRQSFAGNFVGGPVEFRFLITASSEHVFQIRGEGEVTEFVTGSRERHPCRMEGSRLWSLTAQLSGWNLMEDGGQTSDALTSTTSVKFTSTSMNGDGTTLS